MNPKPLTLLFLFSLSLAACQPSLNKGLVELQGFGDNPGNLAGYYHTPDSLPAGAPLVVVLHGCTQDAAEVARLSGWNELADDYGFAVLYPQQKRTNNLTKCFNWFVPEDISRGSGEARSIRQMMSYLFKKLSIDSTSVYATGISAGGAMANVMLAAYPESFRAGASMAGIPYAAAADMAAAFRTMKGEVDLQPDEWEARVRHQNEGFTNPYPALAIFQGADDEIVSPINADELAEQWASLYDIDPAAPAEEGFLSSSERIRRTAYRDSADAIVLLRYDIDNLGHAIAVDPGDGPSQGGAEGPYAKDVDFFASYWAAQFFGLIRERGNAWRN